MLNIIIVVVAAVVLAFMFHPRVTKNNAWHATLTPLSSIIGSGFLILPPLLVSVVGVYSPVAVVGIVLFAYAIGSVIRFNIVYAEPLLHERKAHPLMRKVDLVANAALSFAYVTAVAFYLSLLSAFLLTFLGYENELTLERTLTTAVIVFIASTGYFRGLGGLEKLEAYSMSLQLSIVAALLLGVFVYDFNFMQSEQTLSFEIQDRGMLEKTFILAGILLVVQGFETSRFLGEKYHADVRVRTMRHAQLIAGVLFVVSVIALMPIVQHLDLEHIEVEEIVAATGLVATALPLMLIVAAVMSQFSAAVADTVGAGSLASESSRGKLKTNMGYLVVSIFAIALVWTADLLEIISVASRAFALYYLLQCFVAIMANRHHHEDKVRLKHNAHFFTVAGILAFVVIFAIPAE